MTRGFRGFGFRDGAKIRKRKKVRYMTSVCRENKIQGGFSPSSRSGWSHRMEMEKMQVLRRSSQAPQGAVPGGQQRVCMPATGLAPMGGRAWALAGMC